MAERDSEKEGTAVSFMRTKKYLKSLLPKYTQNLYLEKNRIIRSPARPLSIDNDKLIGITGCPK